MVDRAHGIWQPVLLVLFMNWYWVPAILLASQVGAVEISEIRYEDRPHFMIKSDQVTWYYDRAGGGFSRLIDRDGRDWIAFRKNPLTEYPASAAAGYRGIPNAVFVGPDKGAGHPGFDRCTSETVGQATIRTTSLSRKWRWTWTFAEQTAMFSMERADDEQKWWFLYEGPIAGTFAPENKAWGTDLGGPRSDVPDSKSQVFANWRWVYFGEPGLTSVLFVLQHVPDELPDTLWYLGSSDGGSASSPDGMVVFGFGRGPRAKPQFQGAGHRFTVGLLSATVNSAGDHAKIADRIGGHLK
jgi:hypothetical protein